jgi:hypothetical protein
MEGPGDPFLVHIQFPSFAKKEAYLYVVVFA